jgi:hypothetical protein
MTKLLDARVPVHTGGDAVGVADDNTWLSEFTSMREDFRCCSTIGTRRRRRTIQ